jgi:hypothetical protein
MKTYSVNGTYGSHKTPCEVFVFEKNSGLKWYAVNGSVMVNATYDEISEGIDVEGLADEDCFTWSSKIDSEEELLTAVNN